MIVLTGACGGKDKATDSAAGGDTTTTSAAGGSGTTATSDSGTVAEGACAVLIKSNIEKAVGVPVGAGTPGPQTDNTQTCSWQSADHNTNVNVVKYERAGDLLKDVSAADPNAKPLVGTDHDGLIDVPLGQITMQIGEIGISVSITPAPSEAAQVALAKTVTPG
jgi:hypothetical protein